MSKTINNANGVKNSSNVAVKAQMIEYYLEIDGTIRPIFIALRQKFDRLVEETEQRGANTWMCKGQVKTEKGWALDANSKDYGIVIVTFNDGHTEEMSLYDY